VCRSEFSLSSFVFWFPNENRDSAIGSIADRSEARSSEIGCESVIAISRDLASFVRKRRKNAEVNGGALLERLFKNRDVNEDGDYTTLRNLAVAVAEFSDRGRYDQENGSARARAKMRSALTEDVFTSSVDYSPSVPGVRAMSKCTRTPKAASSGSSRRFSPADALALFLSHDTHWSRHWSINHWSRSLAWIRAPMTSHRWSPTAAAVRTQNQKRWRRR